MRFLPTRIHGLLDYGVGFILMISPWLFSFHYGGAETWVPFVLGLGAIVYSIFTDYELGRVKRVPMPTHLTLDVLSGVFLLASPWVFGFADVVYVPHVLFGLLEILVSLTTQTRPSYDMSGERDI
jgi:hypothetical protein